VRLRLGDRLLDPTPERPLLAGILNASPDSFSDPHPATPPGAEAILARGRELAEAGASIVEVGGESGRTDRGAVSESEEIDRVAPVIERLAGEGLTVSIDTWRPAVARAGLAAGAAMVNDPSGLAEPELAEACAATGAGLVVTHTRVPPKEKGFPRYPDLVGDVVRFLRERAELARGCGVREDRLVLDPGLDLGKTPAESVVVLRRLDSLTQLDRPVMLAASRKDFLGALTGRAPRRRLAGTLAAIEAGLSGGASLLRVHDVAAVADYLRVRAALRGELELLPELRLDEALRREAEPARSEDGEEAA
jgi:dihydropteroate synthase